MGNTEAIRDVDGVLSAPLVIEYPFSRTTGPVVGAFLTGLREQVLVGIRGSDGRVIIPPVEYDPITAEDLTELVEVGPGGNGRELRLGARPHAKHPLDRPFAWALIQPDGADTSMVHAVDVGRPRSDRPPAPGSSSLARRAHGEITDIECFEPGGGAMTEPAPIPCCPRSCFPRTLHAVDPVRSVRTPARLDYDFTAGHARPRRSCGGSSSSKMLGEACPICHKVYVPSRGACPSHGVPTEGIVELPDQGVSSPTAWSTCAFHGSVMELPYVSALIQLEGADMFLMHLIQELKADEVRVGQWVEAVWVDDADLAPTLESMKYFRPIDRPEATVDEAGHVTSWGGEPDA